MNSNQRTNRNPLTLRSASYPIQYGQKALQVSDKQGRTHETRGGVLGAGGGALIGSVFGPIGTILGASLGASIGVATGREIDRHNA